MAEEYRRSTLKGGLSLTFTVLTWATIAPPVALGLALTAVYAYYSLGLTFSQMLPVMAFGFFAMAAHRPCRHDRVALAVQGSAC